MGKARSFSSTDAKLRREIKQLGGIGNQNPDQIGGPFTADPAASQPVPKALLKSGDIMTGPIAFKDSKETLATGAIDVGPTKPGYSSFVILQAESGTADDLTDIKNPRFPGQEITLQADTGDTITIKNSGNIATSDGADYSLTAQKVTKFVYTQLSGKWEQYTGTAGAVASGANTALSNLASVAINTSLISDTNITDDLGSGSIAWHDVFLENARFVSTGTGIGGAGQIYRDAGGMVLNFPTSLKFTLQENAVDVWDWSASTMTGSNIILSDTFTINDSVTDPSAAGEFTRNGADVKVFTGGSVVNLTDVGSGAAGANVTLSNLTADGVLVNTHLEPSASSLRDLGQGDKSWRDLFIEEVRFNVTTTATAGGINIASEALTPDTLVFNVGTNEDFMFIENGDTTDPLIHIDTSGSKMELAGGLTLFVIAANGGGSLFSITKSASAQATFNCTDGYIFQNAAVEFSTGFNITAAGGTADFNANNLIDTGDVLPDAGSTRDIGSGTLDYSNVFADNIRVQAGGTGVGGARQIYGDASGVYINFPSALKLFIQENAVNKWDFSATSMTGANIILSNSLTVNDSTADPTANGQFTRNGTNVKVMTGGIVKSLTDIGTGGGGVTLPIEVTITEDATFTGAETIDLSVGDGHVWKVTLTGNATITFTNYPADKEQREWEIEFIQDSTGGRTVTFPSEVQETVTISSAADSVTIVTFRTNDAGTTVHAIPALRGSISLPTSTFATTELDNLGTTAINAQLNMASNNIDAVGNILPAAGKKLGDSSNIWSSSTVNKYVVGTAGTITGSEPSITASATGIAINVPTGDEVDFRFNDASVFDISASRMTGNAIILSDSITINDSTADPAVAGEIQRNGADVKVFTGGAVKNLTNILVNPLAADFDPASSLTYNLGSASEVWAALFVRNVRFDASTAFITYVSPTMAFEVPGTEFYNWEIGNVIEMTLTASDLDLKGKTMSRLTTVTFEDDNTLGSTPTELNLTFPAATDTFTWDFNSVEKYSWADDGLTETHVGTLEWINYNNTATPADNLNIMNTQWQAQDSAGNANQVYVKQIVHARDTTTGSEAGGIKWQVATGAGTLTDVLEIRGDANASANVGIGFFGTAPLDRPTITGSRGGNAALTDLLQQLAGFGLILDGTSA